MKTNLFLITAACIIVAPSVSAMEQSTYYQQPKSLLQTIVEKKLFEYEDRLIEAEDADERSAIMKEYQAFFKKAEYGNEAIEEIREKILADGATQEPKAIGFKVRLSHAYSDGQDYFYLKVMDAADKTIEYINMSHDPCNAYDILDGTISPDGKLIAILLREYNERGFIALYKKAYQELSTLPQLRQNSRENAEFALEIQGMISL